MNSVFTSTVLDRYAPGLRFGQPVTEIQGRRPPETGSDSQKQSTVKPLHVPKDGFTHVRISGDPLAAPHSRAATVSHRITFFPLRSSGDLSSWRSVIAAINEISDRPARQGCARGELVRIMDSAYVWEQRVGGGAVLLLPPSESTKPQQARVPRLIVFARGDRATDVVQGLEMRPAARAQYSRQGINSVAAHKRAQATVPLL